MYTTTPFPLTPSPSPLPLLLSPSPSSPSTPPTGLHCEGIFRVSPRLKILDEMVTSVNSTGEVDLDTVSDVTATASLLKQFIRRLPDGLINHHYTALFLAIDIGQSPHPSIFSLPFPSPSPLYPLYLLFIPTLYLFTSSIPYPNYPLHL